MVHDFARVPVHAQAARVPVSAPEDLHGRIDRQRSDGTALDGHVRARMESAFGADFSGVRVHTHGAAAALASSVQALAFTTGRDIFFGAGQYRPESTSGLHLLAHELTHVVQQGGAGATGGRSRAIPTAAGEERPRGAQATPITGYTSTARSSAGMVLQRACLTPWECLNERGQSASTRTTRQHPENVAKDKRRRKLCLKTPPDKECRSEGHASRAVELEAFLRSHDPDRLTLIHGIFIDKDIPSEWRAFRLTCNLFVPPLDGSRSCIFVPDTLEEEAAQFNNTSSKSIGGLDRDSWERRAVRTLAHETGHARFQELTPQKPTEEACEFDDIRAELHEIAADLDEAEALDEFLRASSLTPEQQRAEFDDALNSRWIRRARENWTQIRCVCECADADAYLRQVVESMTVDWDRGLLRRVLSAIQEAEPSWPVAPPELYEPGDYPTPRRDIAVA